MRTFVKPFRVWLEEKEANIQDAILNVLGLSKDGLETPLESLDPDEVVRKLKPLGMWTSLPANAQSNLTALITQKVGTVGDLIEKISDFTYTGDSDTGLQPPVGK